MKVEIESFVCNWADEIPHILIRVINAITPMFKLEVQFVKSVNCAFGQ